MKTVDIIIFGGQSNMQGQSERLSECEAVDGALEYRLLTDTLVPLKNPVGEFIRKDGTEGYSFFIQQIKTEHLEMLKEWVAAHALAGASNGYTNLVPSFCREYIKATGSSVIAVHAAKGSTEIGEWLPGSSGYEVLCKKASGAILKAKESFKIGRILFVWLQGESDALKGNSKAYYKDSLFTLAEALRRDIGVEKFGIIRVGRFVHDERDLEIIAAQDEACIESPIFTMLTTLATEFSEMPEYINPNAKGHFNAKGLEDIGRAAGYALGKAVL